ncbi:hypothetical protein SDC9_182269 [bioreactor metagenome]|uniref:Uncharacterized protein n=1 Tax=bioreactor metagenome TaxID=1076179 RepID=A0A645H705_9ZZZZ
MVGVGGDALEPVDQEFAERADVFVLRGQHAHRNRHGGRADELFGPGDLHLEPRVVEIGVGDRHKQRLNGKETEFAVRLVSQRKDLELGDQLIHQIGGFRLFAAHSAERATGILAGFLTLETKHFLVHGLLLLFLG